MHSAHAGVGGRTNGQRGFGTKVLVAYMSSTGNTKKIADVIYDEIDCEKEIRPIADVQDIEAYDLSFLGFPTHQQGPDKKVVDILARHCTNGRNFALFVTHAAPEDAPEVPGWTAGFREAAGCANLVGFFDCQGETARSMKFFLRISPNKRFRTWAKIDNSKGQPDAARLEKARTFARNTMISAASSGKRRPG